MTGSEYGPRPERDVDILRRAAARLRRILPERWSVSVDEDTGLGDRVVDALVVLMSPDGRRATLAAEIKPTVVTTDLPAVLDRIGLLGGSATPVVVARYLGLAAQEWLQRRGVSYLDATGNICLTLDEPALFLRDRGSDSDPWRSRGRPSGSLAGAPAARVVRALVDFPPPATLPALIRRSGASTGVAYRVVELLERESLLSREPRGPIRTVEWRRVVERWSQDYGFQRSNTVGTYLEPRGLAALSDRLASSTGLRYALTGSLAVQHVAPHAEPRVAMIYVDDLDSASDALALRPTETGANVLLASGRVDVAFDRTVKRDGLTLVAPSQAAVDLLTGPGRSPTEGQALLDWMETHEGVWRQ